MQDHYDNYPRLTWIRRVFEFTAGSGMLHAEGDPVAAAPPADQPDP